MTWNLRLVTEPGVEPVTLEEAKLHLRVDVDDDDDLITALIVAARQMVENILRRALVSQSWELNLDAFPGVDTVEVPLPPLQSVEALTYTDASGVSHTLSAAAYSVDTYSTPGRVRLNDGYAWPGDTLAAVNGVQIAFTAGFGDAGTDVPQAIRQALLLMVGHLYENREAVTDTRVLQTTPLALEYLLWPYRVLTW
jgi:uncharacterized phiE125 gp8 family phage protein